MKYLIVGLGNMGPKYDDTRHNIGFDVVDHLAEEADVPFKNVMYGDMAELKHKGRKMILLKPSTYMNLSGKAVRYWIQKLKIQDENLLVVVDDLNLDFGKIRLKGKGSDGGHNGLKSLNQLLGTQRYSRLRVGIGDKFHNGQQVNFVLGKWTDEEKKELPTIIEKCGEVVKSYCTIGLAHTMSKFNG